MQRPLIALALLGVAQFATAQRKPQTFAVKEATNLTTQLFKAIAPALPQNSYMTQFMREKIGGVYAGIGIHQFSVALWDNRDGTMGPHNLLMSSGYDPDKGTPVLRVSISRLYEIIRQEQHITTGFSQAQKNGFALALVRAVIHLEHPPSFFTIPHPKDEIIREELRVYRKVDQMAVAHLLKIGQPAKLDVDYQEVHAILARCGKSEDCPAFQKYYKGKKILGHTD